MAHEELRRRIRLMPYDAIMLLTGKEMWKLTGCFDEVTGFEGFRHQQGQTGKEIGQDVLNGKRKGKTCDADQGNQRSGRDAQSTGDDDSGQNPEDDLDGRVDEAL